MQRWQSGVLTAWLKYHGLQEALEQIADVEKQLGTEHPAAAFETILRLLDPSLPPVQLELDRSALRGIHKVPFGVTRRVRLPYQTVSRGVPFGVFTGTTPTQEIVLDETLVSQRSDTLTVVIDIDQEPFDCNIHQVELRLESGFTKLAGDPYVLWYRMTVMAYLTWSYVLVGATIGSLFFLLPRILAASFGGES
jgi:hypothetical protein